MARASFEKGYGARLAEGQSFTTNAKRIAAFAAPTKHPVLSNPQALSRIARAVPRKPRH